MKFIIHHGEVEEIILSGETIEQIQLEAQRQIKMRGWREDDCWSEAV